MTDKDTLGGASKRDIALATTIGVFTLIGLMVGASYTYCYVDPTVICPVFSQDHFDRAVDMFFYLALAGAILVGLKITRDGNFIVPPRVVQDTPKPPSTG